MAENGGGRLDRIEALLDKLAERQRDFQIIQEHDHEEFKRDHQQLMTWQVLMQEKMDQFAADREADRQRAEADRQRAEADRQRTEAERKRLDELWANTDARIADLVRAIGRLIERPLPPGGGTQ